MARCPLADLLDVPGQCTRGRYGDLRDTPLLFSTSYLSTANTELEESIDLTINLYFKYTESRDMEVHSDHARVFS